MSLLGLLLAADLAGAASGAESNGARGPLDLNRATAEELESLPGIGAAKAAAIIAARDAQGGFASPDDLESVRGIGPALMAKLRPLVAVGGGKAPAPAPAPKASPPPRAAAPAAR